MKLNPLVWCNRCLVLFLTLVMSAGLHAQTLEEAVQAARQNDPQYAADMAAVQSRHALARQSGTAYWPYAGIVYTRSDLNAGGNSNKVLSLTQPLINYDRYLSVRQADDIHGLADAEAGLAHQHMVLRVFGAMAEIIRQREALRSNQAQIEGLQEQLQRAQRMLQLGQGTVTEVSDFDARLATAQANRVAVQNTLDNAVLTFRQLTGTEPDVSQMNLQVDFGKNDNNLPDLTAQARENAIVVQQARHNLKLAEIAAKKVRAQYVPQIYAQAARVQYGDNPRVSSNQIGVALSATLGAPQYYEDQRATAEVQKAEQALRYARESAVSEVVQLYTSANALELEIKARERAVQAARQAVQATIKSYQAGVKSNTEVISSYQVLVDAENQLTNTNLAFLEKNIRLVVMFS